MGARRLAQLEDNLGATAVDLSHEALERLESVTSFRRGFPLDFIDETAAWVFGAAMTRLEEPQ